MKSDARKKSTHAHDSAHTTQSIAEHTVADADYASQLFAAADALDSKTSTENSAMSNPTESQDNLSSVMVLPAQCLMRDAVDLKAQLMTRLETVEAVQIDVAQLERIDAAAMQVLLAFVLDRGKRERNVEWCGVNPAFKEAAQALGLEATLRLPALGQAA